jgi:hypothetical protein
MVAKFAQMDITLLDTIAAVAPLNANLVLTSYCAIHAIQAII